MMRTLSVELFTSLLSVSMLVVTGRSAGAFASLTNQRMLGQRQMNGTERHHFKLSSYNYVYIVQVKFTSQKP